MISALIFQSMLNRGHNEMNSRDVDRLLKHWTDDAVLIYPGNMPFSGRIEGKPMLKAFFETYYRHFPQLDFKTKQSYIGNILSMGGSNVVAVESNLRYTNIHGKAFENSVMTSIKIEGGKVKEDKDYYHDVAALNAAWEGADLSLMQPFLDKRS